jgi:hypothetical protein
MFVGHFCPPGSGSGYGSRDPIESGYGSGSTTLAETLVQPTTTDPPPTYNGARSGGCQMEDVPVGGDLSAHLQPGPAHQHRHSHMLAAQPRRQHQRRYAARVRRVATRLETEKGNVMFIVNIGVGDPDPHVLGIKDPDTLVRGAHPGPGADPGPAPDPSLF